MPRIRPKSGPTLAQKYPSSEPCSCEVCLSYCARPGWWTVAEAEAAIRAGWAGRMMLELSPDRTFGVLSPAFRGCEGTYALQENSFNNCTFLENGLCQLHGLGYMPLECRFCHHDRPGMGPICHADLEKDWNTPAGRILVERWQRITGFWKKRVNQQMRMLLKVK